MPEISTEYELWITTRTMTIFAPQHKKTTWKVPQLSCHPSSLPFFGPLRVLQVETQPVGKCLTQLRGALIISPQMKTSRWLALHKTVGTTICTIGFRNLATDWCGGWNTRQGSSTIDNITSSCVVTLGIKTNRSWRNFSATKLFPGSISNVSRMISWHSI